MSPRNGLILRLVGPMIEVACAILLTRDREPGRTLGGVSVDSLLYAGLALGFAMVVAGLVFGRPSRGREGRP